MQCVSICNIYSTVGRSLAIIYDLRRHIYFTKAQSTEVNMSSQVVYIGYRLTYHIIYTYSTVSVQQTNLLPENTFQSNAIRPKVYIPYIRPPSNA